MTNTDTIAYSPRHDSSMRWVEHASAGLRIVGSAHDLAPHAVQHRGWYMDPDGYSAGEVAVGYVLRLPHGRLVPAMLAPYNADCYLVDFSNVHDVRALVGSRLGYRDEDDIVRACAVAADSIAERYAEREREFQECEEARVCAAQSWLDALRHIRVMRADHSALIVVDNATGARLRRNARAVAPNGSLRFGYAAVNRAIRAGLIDARARIIASAFAAADN